MMGVGVPSHSASGIPSIQTMRGPFSFTPVSLYPGRKIIDREQASRNLALFQHVAEKHGLKFGLMYGTLLGAVRDGDLIPWDEDIDLYALDEQRPVLHNMLWDLRDHGLALVRHVGDLYSFMQNDDYIDVYVFRGRGRVRKCNEDRINVRHLTFRQTAQLRGMTLFIPSDHESLLERLYGSGWRVPQRNKPAQADAALIRLRHALGRKFPHLQKVYTWMRNALRKY